MAVVVVFLFVCLLASLTDREIKLFFVCHFSSLKMDGWRSRRGAVRMVVRV